MTSRLASWDDPDWADRLLEMHRQEIIIREQQKRFYDTLNEQLGLTSGQPGLRARRLTSLVTPISSSPIGTNPYSRVLELMPKREPAETEDYILPWLELGVE